MIRTNKIPFVLIIVAFLAAYGPRAFTQSKLPVRYFEQVRTESQLSYNFFAGSDAADFSTSIKGFGSGILDLLGTRTSVDLVQLGSGKIFLSFGAGFAVMKYRFSKNLVFGNTPDNKLTWTIDPDKTRNYVNSFFGYGKSKLITTSFYFPVDLNILLGKNVVVTAGSYLDLNLTARYKMKYLTGEDEVKEIIRSDEFRCLNPGTTKFGVNATFFHRKIGYGFSATYCLSPFFKSGTGPDIHEARISISYKILNLKKSRVEKDRSLPVQPL